MTSKLAALLTLASSALAIPRDAIKRGDSNCPALPLGSGPAPNPDTVDSFLSNAFFIETSKTAKDPPGFANTYTNLNAANENKATYLGYSLLDSYSPSACASFCKTKLGCTSFSIFFERAPSVNLGPLCPDPPSTTLIKCSLYSAAIHPQDATNKGQFRSKFQLVIAGNNGYVSTTTSDPNIPDWRFQYLGDAAIIAHKDCNNVDTYLRYRSYPLPYDPKNCAAACKEHSDYHLQHPPADGSPARLCGFFNSYILSNNGVPQEQRCSLYTRAWPKTYATNKGQWRGQDRITISESYGYENGSEPCSVCLPKGAA
ncbi:hypothetical protein B0J11DRAFT_497392 [Dendryphion nanum]|uniref:Uncharacterized protein n=1 Tax=Dendryphion nanum TaxID=256645 RepID=A0A9P9D7I8_9PLEO|nr:hypothetical protein B0J11DRAFT_497392 [Dendryphion nanum]